MGATIGRVAGGLLGLALLAGAPGAAHALGMKECSQKYQAAKKNGTLGGQDWKSFRASQCAAAPAAATAGTDPAGTPTSGAGKSAPGGAATASTAAAPAAPAAAPAPTQGAGKSAAAPAAAAAPVATGNVVFPSAVSPKYSSLSAGKARMKTCVDQYDANKASGGNGGLKWIQKGGGYYSECSKKLKGA